MGPQQKKLQQSAASSLSSSQQPQQLSPEIDKTSLSKKESYAQRRTSDSHRYKGATSITTQTSTPPLQQQPTTLAMTQQRRQQKQKQSTRQRSPSLSCNLRRTVLLRIILIGSLLTAAGVCAALSYIVLSNAERNTAAQTYRSIALSATLNAKAIVERKFQASEVTAALASWSNPDAADWPLIFINGYMHITDKIARLAQSTTQATVVFLNPSQTEAFESHIAGVYATEGRPNTTGYSDFGFGIWKPDLDPNNNQTFEDGREHDTTGEVSKNAAVASAWLYSFLLELLSLMIHCVLLLIYPSFPLSIPQNAWGGQDERLAVLALHNVPNPSSILYNAYSEEDRGIYVDSMNACVRAHNDTTTSPTCAAFSDMLELKIRAGPAALLFHPIFPANDPTEFVGIASTSMHWEEALDNIVPDYVNGLTCVVSTTTASFTYEVQSGGVIQLMGDGDMHDERYDDYAHSVVLNEIQTGADTSAVYTLTVYPSATMFQTFATKSPLVVALAFLGVILFCAMLFFLYDVLMRHEAEQRKLILDMKRRFVRFISHEIRTPLNTVCVGLELLERELKKDTPKGGVDKDGTSATPTLEDMNFWHTITIDMKENAGIAVSILNDMLNYDKLETKTLELETEEVNPWALIEQTVNQFQLQSIDRDVDIKLTIEQPEYGSNRSSIVESLRSENCRSDGGPTDIENGDLCVIGDEVRLSQVFRNIISNALKFTPKDGKIIVSVTHVVKGLPNADGMFLKENPIASEYRCGSLLVRITDSGVGLTKEQLEMLFGEGVQFDANKLQHGGGSGLGLNIAKGIVELHHGTIEAQSEGQGHGTSFVIELPLYTIISSGDEHNGEEGTSPTQKQTEIGSCDMVENTEPLQKKKKRRILVVEDALSSRKMLIRLLEREGHTCLGASNGRDAVEMVEHDMERSRLDMSLRQQGYESPAPQNNRFDDILMDFEMPFMNGPDATVAIRELGYKGSIVGVTGNVMVEDVDHFKACGANEVLAKPISMEKLREYWERRA